MKQLYIILALCLSLNAYTLAQLQIKHQRTLGGYSDDYLQSLDLTTDGGTIIGGTSISIASAEKSANNNGLQDYWLLLLNSEGKIKWDKTIGGNAEDYLRFVKQTRDGNYILAGSSNSNISGNKTQNCKGGFDFWIIKIDKNKNILWDKTIGGNCADFFSAAQETIDGGILLAGYSCSNKSFDKTKNSRGGFDYWIVKIDKHGNVEWDNTIGGSDDDLLISVASTKDGGFILGGYSISGISGEKTAICRGQYDYWIVKISCTGKVEWDKTIGGSSWDYLKSVEQTSDGGYIVGGYTYSDKSGDKTENNKGYTDYWIVKLSRNGNIQWDKTLGGKGDDILTSIQQTADGYIIGGSSFSNDLIGEPFNTPNNYNYLFTKIDINGNLQWNKMFGGNNQDFLSCMMPTRKNYWITGGSSLSGKTEDKDQKCRGGYDFWVTVMKCDAAGEIGSKESNTIIQNTNENTFSVYPNPANNWLYLKNRDDETFALTDEWGKILMTKKINGNGSINISALPAGIYYLKNLTTFKVKKVVIVR